MKRTLAIFALLAVAAGVTLADYTIKATAGNPAVVSVTAGVVDKVGVTPAASGFIATWVVTNGGSITLPLRSSYTYNMTVDYGDGTVVNVNSNNDPDATHQFTSGVSNRTVLITGTMGAWYFNNGGSKANFSGVSLWEPVSGVAALGLENAFYGCTEAINFANGIAASWIPVTSLAGTWRSCTGIKNGFPEVNTLTNVNTLSSTWNACSGNTNRFPAVSNLTKVTTLFYAWKGCSGSYFNLQDVLGDCLWITGQVNNVSFAFSGNNRMTGNGMPLVTAITNSPGYPTGYTITNCFDGCTNLTDWATIPEAFK